MTSETDLFALSHADGPERRGGSLASTSLSLISPRWQAATPLILEWLVKVLDQNLGGQSDQNRVPLRLAVVRPSCHAII